jgi:hypothetical protein
LNEISSRGNHRQTNRKIEGRKEPIDRQKMDCLENKWTDRQVDKQADRKRDILEIERQTNGQTEKGTYWK